MLRNDDRWCTGDGSSNRITRRLGLSRVFTDHHTIVIIHISDGWRNPFCFHRFHLFGITSWFDLKQGNDVRWLFTYPDTFFSLKCIPFYAVRIKWGHSLLGESEGKSIKIKNNLRPAVREMVALREKTTLNGNIRREERMKCVSTWSWAENMRAERGWNTSASEKDLRLWLDKLWEIELRAVAICVLYRV